MRVLITGAAGFIGLSTVQEALGRGHQVLALIRGPAPAEWRGVARLEIIHCDLAGDRVPGLGDRGIDVIVHLAAAMRGDCARQIRDTLEGTEALLEAARAAGITRLVGIGSLAVLDYSRLPAMSLIDENTATAPAQRLTGYARHKRSQEDRLRAFAAAEGHGCWLLRAGLAYDESQLSVAHAGLLAGPLGLLSLHAGLVPVIGRQALSAAIIAAAERPLRGLRLLHLLDEPLPGQRAYLAALRRRGALPAVCLDLPWRVLQALSGAGRALLRAAGRGEEAMPEALQRHGFAARFKPFRFSAAGARSALGRTPTRTLP